ncbi:MAG: SAM-dependent methyltransferase [Actinomycetota bacterium]|nr:SAM-dependent methyltransferase [Actinomycetota bacterium]
MSDCCNPSGYRHFFNQKEARRNLAHYDKKGLDKTARRMVDYLASRGVEGRSVLEVGGGIGALHVELLKAGAADAVNVELSGGYEDVAAELLEREGLGERVERHLGDFTELAAGLEADDVVMNRVICCYPNMERLMGAALSSSRRFVAATFPRDRAGARIGLSLGNAYCWVRKIDFRAFVHPPDAIRETARKAGFKVAFRDQDFIWQGVVFEKAS